MLLKIWKFCIIVEDCVYLVKTFRFYMRKVVKKWRRLAKHLIGECYHLLECSYFKLQR